eukprot:5463960-Alexandrium_andersonii.AAC.1
MGAAWRCPSPKWRWLRGLVALILDQVEIFHELAHRSICLVGGNNPGGSQHCGNVNDCINLDLCEAEPSVGKFLDAISDPCGAELLHQLRHAAEAGRALSKFSLRSLARPDIDRAPSAKHRRYRLQQIGAKHQQERSRLGSAGRHGGDDPEQA